MKKTDMNTSMKNEKSSHALYVTAALAVLALQPSASPASAQATEETPTADVAATVQAPAANEPSAVAPSTPAPATETPEAVQPLENGAVNVTSPDIMVPSDDAGLADARNRASENVTPITLTDAIYLTLQNNPQRDAAQAAVVAARARIRGARAQGRPQVDLSGDVGLDRSFGRSSTSFGGGGSGGPGGPGTPGGPGGGFGGSSFDTPTFLGFNRSASLGVSANVPVYTGGRVRAGTRAAEAQARAQAAQTLQIEQDLVLSTIDAYLSILRSEQLLDVATSDVEISRERLRIAQVRFDAGASPRLDVFTAQATLAEAQTNRIQASNSLAQSKAALNTLLSRAPETPVRVEPITRLSLQVPLPAGIGAAPSTQGATTPENGTATPESGTSDANSSTGAGATDATGAGNGLTAVSGESANSAQLRALAEQARPSLERGREQVNAAEANIDAARAQRRPSLGLSIGSFLRDPVTSVGRFALSLGLGVAQTLFDSGRISSQVEEARATRNQFRQDLQGERLQIANEIEQNLLALDSAASRERNASVGVLAAQEALRATQIGYQAGARTALEVSEAQDQLLEAQTQAVNARFDVALSQAQLSAAVGVLTTEGQAAYQRALEAEQTQQANLQRVAAKQKKKR
jgi:outer membrane protein